MLDKSFYEKTDEILSNYSLEEKSLIPIAQDVQAAFTYIPPEILCYVASKIGISDARAYSVTSFYENFSYEAKGTYVIKVCDGTACHIRGSMTLVEGITRALGISDGETTEDGLFSLELVNCLGSCALAPVMVVDDTYYGKMTMEKLPGVIESYRKEG